MIDIILFLSDDDELEWFVDGTVYDTGYGEELIGEPGIGLETKSVFIFFEPCDFNVISALEAFIERTCNAFIEEINRAIAQLKK